jgi:predicted deacylase
VTSHDEPRPFVYDETMDPVLPGEKRHFTYPVGETFLGQDVEMPVTVINGAHAGPRLFLSAAVHGDELNGVKLLQEVAVTTDPATLHGTIVCLHVVNVPGYIAQTRYLPVYDQDLNRKFPGSSSGSTAARMARVVFDRFVSKCDMGLDFHTSTRNRMTVLHARADTSDPAVRKLAETFGTSLVISSPGSTGMLRRVASEHGIPTVTIEMGEANRFQPLLVDAAMDGLQNVLAAYGLDPEAEYRPATFQKVLTDPSEKRWVRAETGGIVEMLWGPLPVVEAGDPICRIVDYVNAESAVVHAPFTGFLGGILANPRVLPGHPLVHLIAIEEADRAEVRRVFEGVGFERHGTFHWMGRQEPAAETATDTGPAEEAAGD